MGAGIRVGMGAGVREGVRAGMGAGMRAGVGAAVRPAHLDERLHDLVQPLPLPHEPQHPQHTQHPQDPQEGDIDSKALEGDRDQQVKQREDHDGAVDDVPLVRPVTGTE